MNLSQSTLSFVAVAALALACISMAYAVLLSRRLRRVRRGMTARRAAASMDRGAGDPSGFMVTDADLADIRETMAHAVQRVGMVRFDAFEDMGGKLSFAAALLDAEGSGIVLSSIAGRADSRVYAKPIERGASTYNLSGEEGEAIKRALDGVRR